jgi:hypothetical protein
VAHFQPLSAALGAKAERLQGIDGGGLGRHGVECNKNTTVKQNGRKAKRGSVDGLASFFVELLAKRHGKTFCISFCCAKSSMQLTGSPAAIVL